MIRKLLSKAHFRLAFALVLLAFAPADGTAQQTDVPSTPALVLRGKVVDAATREALSYATLSIPRLGIGTATNDEGRFSLQLPGSAGDEVLMVTFMGYTTRTFRVADLAEDATLALQPKSYQMAEVVVTQRDFCKELLRNAWKAIPQNFPTGPTLCQGFYRETERLKDSTFLYFNEAVLDVYKNSYRNSINFGQIQVEKSRKNVFPGIDSINDVRFYGGPHFPNDLDIVFSRWDFIKPSEYANWKIELAGSYRDSTSNIYVLTFKNRRLPNSSFQGKMYIDRDSYAFVGFDFWRAGMSNLAGAQLPDMEYIPGMTSIRIGYTQKDGRYHLGYINYKTNGLNTASRKRIYKDIDYVTTSVRTENVEPIPFARQFDYTDILSIEAQPYDSSYWKDYNILEQSNVMNKQATLTYQKDEALKQLTKTYNKELTQQEKVLLFLKRFSFDGGFAYLPVQHTGGTYALTFDGLDLGSREVGTTRFGITTMDGIRFEWKKNLHLVTTVSTALYGVELFQWDLGAALRLPVTRSGRRWFMDLGLAASTRTARLELGTFDNPSASTRLGGKVFDSERITLKAGQSNQGLTGILGLAMRIGKQSELFVDASYNQWILKKEYLQLKEADGFFLGRSSIKTEWDDAGHVLSVDGANTAKPTFDLQPYNLRIGIRSSF